jgi:hypothetical protein
LAFIGLLLRQSNRLRLLGTQLHSQAATRGRDAQVLVSQPAHQVEGLARRLFERQPLGVLRDALLHGCSHLRRGTEEAIGRHEPLDALVRSLEVVSVDEEPEAPVAVSEVRKHRLAEKLLPERLPETLHLAQRLRVLRPALDVPDALTPELPLEVRLAPPRRVLASLVRQYLLRRAVSRDPARQRLEHQRPSLVVRQGMAHDESGVVVHEGCQVQPLVASQQEGEDVRLPHLVGSGPLEAPRRVLARRRRLGCLQQPLLVQDATHRRLAHAQALEASQHVTDAARAVLGVLLPSLDDCMRLRLRRSALASWRDPWLWDQSVKTSPLVGDQPRLDRRDTRTEDLREPRKAHVTVKRLLDHLHPERQGVGLTPCCQLTGLAGQCSTTASTSALFVPSTHLRLSSP